MKYSSRLSLSKYHIPLYTLIYMQDIYAYIQTTLDRLSKDDIVHRPVFISILRLTSLLRIQAYLAYIENRQRTYANTNNCTNSAKDKNSGKNKNYFCTSLTYQQLPHKINLSIKNIVSFLTSQFSSIYTLNYIHRDILSPYPDDIDDTFSALFAIQNYLPHWTTGSRLATILFTLDKIRDKDTPHLFNTWYKTLSTSDTSSDSWYSLDFVALSAIVAYFESIHLPCEELKAYVIENMKNFTAETSEFYPYSYMALYLLSRLQISSTEFGDIAHRIKDNHTSHGLSHKTSLPYQPDQYQNLIIASIYWNHFQTESALSAFVSDTYELSTPKIVYPHTDNSVHLYIESENPRVYATDTIFDQLIYIESTLGQIVHMFSRTCTYPSPQTDIYPCIETCKTSVLEHLKTYIDQTHYTSSIKTDLINTLTHILDSKDFKIICAMHRDIPNVIRTHPSGIQTTHDVLKDFSTLLYAYYLYDQIADYKDKHFLLPLFVTVYRAGITALKDLYTSYSIHWDTAESILYTCDSFYMSIFRSGIPRQTLEDSISICSHIPITSHAHKSCGLQIFLPLICRTIDVWDDPLSCPSWYSPLYSYIDYTVCIVSKAMDAIQLSRHLADDLDDFNEDIQIQKITTAYYCIEQGKLNTYKQISLILRHIDMAQVYLSILHTSLHKTHISHTLACLQDIVQSIKNHLIQKKRDKVVLSELDRLTSILH